MNIIHSEYRRPESLRRPSIENVLPSYFIEEYPSFIEFLNVYYDYMAQKGSWTEILGTDLLLIRDLDATSLSLLDKIFFEIGNGSNSRFFEDPRLVGKVINFFLRKKGTEYSVMGFFRMFFGETPTIVYPKENIFIVSESQIGYESLRFIIDDERYQIYSILIQSGIPIAQWQTLYKAFAHPAGFHLAGDVLTEGIACFEDSAPLSIGLADDIILETILDVSSIMSAPDDPMTVLYDSGDIQFRMASYKVMGNYDSGTTLGELANLYGSVRDLEKATSPTMDMDSDGIIIPIDASNVIETGDQGIFEDYIDSDMIADVVAPAIVPLSATGVYSYDSGVINNIDAYGVQWWDDNRANGNYIALESVAFDASQGNHVDSDGAIHMFGYNGGMTIRGYSGWLDSGMNIALAYRSYAKDTDISNILYDGLSDQAGVMEQNDSAGQIDIGTYGGSSVEIAGTTYDNTKTRDQLYDAVHANNVMTFRNVNLTGSNGPSLGFAYDSDAWEFGAYALVFFTDSNEMGDAINYVSSYLP